jgi:preprotein translocase subunit SecD
VKGTRRLVLSVVVVAGLVGGAVAGFVTGTRPKLGLDLVGGVSVVLEAPAGTSEDVMNRAIENIRNRVDSQGVSEASIGLVGGRDIQVEIPGLTQGTVTAKNGKFCAETSGKEQVRNPETGQLCDFATRSEAQAAVQAQGQRRLLQLIGTTARLEEREVLGQPTSDEKVTACPPEFAGDPNWAQCNNTKFVQCPLNKPDQAGCSSRDLEDKDIVLVDAENDPNSFDAAPKLKLGPVQITGEAISRARAQAPDESHFGWWVSFTLNSQGKTTFGEVTTKLQGKQLAIILDRAVESAPTVRSPITGGNGEITGNFSESEAKDLATVLNFGALPVELRRLNVETVSPTLGKQSLHQGLIAGIAGLILLALYLAFYYRLLGVVTWVGMAIWATFALTLVSLLGKAAGYALSLAGVAGIIVSLGVTADSYIVFYERLKDEVRHGKTLRTAVGPAFRRAWRTIYTADIVTALAAGVLYFVSVGSVRGFALTLGLSTALDLFVVYFFKRPTVFLIARSPLLSNLRGIGLRSGVAAEPVPAPVAGGSK